MADFGSVDGRPEASGDGAGRLSASEMRPVDASGRGWSGTVEEGLMADLDVVEKEAREAREEAARLRARVAALEAALRDIDRRLDDNEAISASYAVVAALHGGTRALDAAVAAAVAAERKRWTAVLDVFEKGFV